MPAHRPGQHEDRHPFVRAADPPALTGLLHRALNFTAVDQGEQTTLIRASGGHCWVAVESARLVATLTISLPRSKPWPG